MLGNRWVSLRQIWKVASLRQIDRTEIGSFQHPLLSVFPKDRERQQLQAAGQMLKVLWSLRLVLATSSFLLYQSVPRKKRSDGRRTKESLFWFPACAEDVRFSLKAAPCFPIPESGWTSLICPDLFGFTLRSECD